MTKGKNVAKRNNVSFQLYIADRLYMLEDYIRTSPPNFDKKLIFIFRDFVKPV